MANSNIQDLLTKFGSSDKVEPHVKRYEVFEIEEDLLVLSATWYRLRQETKKGKPHISIEKLLDKTLLKYVTEEDREFAYKIRDFYCKKIVVWTLKEVQLSKFRQDLSTFVNSNGKVFKSDMLPLVYRLPEFYAYDVAFEELANEHNKIIKGSSVMATKTLKFQKSFITGKKYVRRKEYWFTDEHDNLVQMVFSQDNPLLPLLEFSCSRPINLIGNFNFRHRDSVQYFLAEKYSFA